MSKLVIVESPAKAKTIKKYLGPDFEVKASMGHVRDLPKSKLGIDVDHAFAPQYVNIDGKTPLIRELQEAAAKSDFVYLATDPDREGEAISWHLAQLLALNLQESNRVTFNEITKSGVKEGMSKPRCLDLDYVDAQQARRVLDRLVGYKISPFLWRKVRRGLSAGRVQSVAVKILVDREREIRAFVPEEYWTLDALLKTGTQADVFKARFYGTPESKLDVKTKEEADKILADLKGAAYAVDSVKKSVRKRRPLPPFITSTLQQEASKKLNFTAKRTMSVAQALYEGVEITGLGTTGLITYMRTDSLRISEEARAAAVALIRERYGDEYLPEKPAYYKSRSSAQDAHEAIRPAMPELTPERVKADLTAEQFKLYSLIWSRFFASLMAPCVQDTIAVDVTAGRYLFKATGYRVRFPGYTVLYDDKADNEDEKYLPPVKPGDALQLKKLESEQHFTQPPLRYTEATLIKALEDKNIGRPSTYAPIITTVMQREYVEVEKKFLKPTSLGEIVTELMEQNFDSIVDESFTAKMEKELDEIESGKRQWVKVIDAFYADFVKSLEKAENSLDGKKIKVPEVESDVICDLCGRKMVVKTGRFGKFLACPGFPACKNTKPIVQEMPGACPKCGAKIIQRKSAKGYKYYSCEKGKACGFITWNEPTAKTCPQCGKTLFKARGGLIKCEAEGCGY
ncbi:MAG: type I DNA topoisomerase [Clostridia bacterium]|nr:type I DNA topoisomerase [Clostridia bacterium]